MLTVVLMIAAQFASATPPADRDILRALPKVAPGSGVVGVFRDDIVIVKQPLAAKAGPACQILGVEPGRVIESQWECAVYYTEMVQLAFPFPVTVKKPRVAVVYLATEEVRFGK